jgi:hypothetical protein
LSQESVSDQYRARRAPALVREGLYAHHLGYCFNHSQGELSAAVAALEPPLTGTTRFSLLSACRNGCTQSGVEGPMSERITRPREYRLTRRRARARWRRSPKAGGGNDAHAGAGVDPYRAAIKATMCFMVGLCLRRSARVVHGTQEH